MNNLGTINWKFVESVSDVNVKEGTVSVNFIDGQKITEFVPQKLMQALISKGKQEYMDQDIERFEWDSNRRD